MVRWLPGAPRTEDATHPILFAGTLASTKLDKSAVRRNRMRRRSREALRTVLRDEKMPLTLSAQLLLLPRSSSLNTPFPELQADIRAFLRTLHG
jgi:ribonuclease P protein component